MITEPAPTAATADEQREKDRADRREEIKLRLEYAKSAVSVAGLIGIGIAVLQWHSSNITARDNAITARQDAITAQQTAYARIATEWRDHVRLLTDKPDLRPYFADSRALDINDPNRNLVLAMADHRLEVMDSILMYASIAGATGQIGGWIQTFQHAFRNSPALCQRGAEVQQNYGDKLREVRSESCSR